MAQVTGYRISSSLTQLTLLLLIAASHARFRDKLNVTREFSSEPMTFESDEDIVRYLNERNTDVKLWNCKNGVEVLYRRKPAAFELSCEILGRVKSIEFTHNVQLLDIGQKYQLTAYPHRVKDKFLSRWLDYSLRINEPNLDDSGMYTIKVTGASGRVEQQLIFVSIKKMPEPEVRAGNRQRDESRKNRRRRRKNKRRNRKNRKSRRRPNRYRWQTQFLT